MSDLFIRRPIATTLVMLAILFFGLFAYRILPVSDLPSVDFPTIQVFASLPGASPETMASSVATPLEKQFSTIEGLDSMSSVNQLGSTQVTLQFNISRSLDGVAQDVQTAITKAGAQLPQNMPSPPSFSKVNPADQPVIYITMSSESLPISAVNEYAETYLAQRISTISGVAQVSIFGAQKYAVRVQLDPRALASRGVGIDEVQKAVQAANVNLPTGTLWGAHRAVTVQANGQLTNAAAYRPLIVAYRNGSPVRLDDVGTVLDSVETDKIASWFNGVRAIVLAIQKQPGTNTVQVVDAIRKNLPVYRQQIPPAVNMVILYDRSVSIRDSVRDVKFTLLLTIALVILVIFLFLRNLSATVIPSLAVPLSIIGTFAGMYLLNFSVDNLSLMAVTLSVGFVVDDAIVMLENIVRHMEAGEPVLEAAFRGSREVSFTILSMTLSLAAVFLPVLFMGGILGRLLHEFSVTIGMAILVSGFVSLTLTPMLCSRFLRAHSQQTHGRLFNLFENGYQAVERAYENSLRIALRYRLATVMLSVVMLVASVVLFRSIPKGFLPSEDTGQIFIFTEAQEGISYDSMVEHQKQLMEIAMRHPAVANSMSSIGGGTAGVVGASNAGRLFLRLKPRNTRQHVDQIVNELRAQLAVVPGIRAYPQNLPPIRIGGQLTKALYQFTMQGSDTAELYRAAALFEEKVRALPGLQDVNSDMQIKNPQVDVKIDRERAASLGVSAQQIEEALYSSYGARQVSTIYTPTNEYRVITELEPRYQRDANALPLLFIRSTSGSLVPLDAVASLSPSVGPMAINHLGQLPAVTISFNLRQDVSLGTAVEEISELARRNLPATISTSFQGAAQAFESSMAGLGILLLMSVLVIYIILGILYESFIHPLTILSGLPSAAFGALFTLKLFKSELNLYAFVGVIMLVGIVKKNAIMMIDFALDAQRKDNLPPAEAIFKGSVVRFRPIMMTTMCALMGTLPIALGLGAGSEARRPLGLAVVGGLLLSQVVTLYLTPAVYIYMDQFESWIKRSAQRRPAHASVTPAD
ncbi:MAG: efflux RND transporter permease subunit [Acidobacteriia bacterium]|nr:efflux RND transporter permease subunit [Terriglobia bacterium]